MRSFQLFDLLAVALLVTFSEIAAAFQNCTTSFSPVTVSAAFAALNPGWNLGNTLDAIPNEGSWNNPPAQASTLAQVKARGFKSIRVPGRQILPPLSKF